MQTEAMDMADDKRVWLNHDELKDFFKKFDKKKSGEDCHDDNMEKEVAVKLMGVSGCRTQEMLDATPGHLRTVETDEGTITKLHIPDGKDGKERDTIVPERFGDFLSTYARAYGIDESEPFVDRNRRTIQRWMNAAGEHMAELTGKEDWSHFSAHDLRRCAAMHLVNSGTAPTVVMDLFGWENYKTFREHYMERHSDSALARETAKAF